jgi:hypothetical protein
MERIFEPVREGDWVSGTSELDEKFIGYVESLDAGGIIRVVVTQCDREDTVGMTIETKLAKVKKMQPYTPSSPEELHSLIDIALMTHDKAWFEDLRAMLAMASFKPADGLGSGNRKGENRRWRLSI